MGRRPELTRSEILAFRRGVGSLDQRLPPGRRSLRQAAWAGLQDSMPRAALLSLHARVEGTEHSTWEDPSLVQLWGPRFSVFVVAAADLAIFSLGRSSDEAAGRRRAEDLAARLADVLRGGRMSYGDAGDALGVHPNRLRYAAATGTVLIRWEGARQPTVWTVGAPAVDPREARLELARRYLHVYGPATTAGFQWWAGLGAGSGAAAFGALRSSLTPVQTPIGEDGSSAGTRRRFVTRGSSRTPVAGRASPWSRCSRGDGCRPSSGTGSRRRRDPCRFVTSKAASASVGRPERPGHHQVGRDSSHDTRYPAHCRAERISRVERVQK